MMQAISVQAAAIFFAASSHKVNKLLELQKITRRVSANAKLGKYYQVGALLFCLVDMVDNFGGIRFKITNVIVKLCQCDLHIADDIKLLALM